MSVYGILHYAYEHRFNARGKEMLNVNNKKVLIIEDEYLIAMELEQLFTEAGAIVLGPYASLDAAAESVDKADAGVLDIKIGGDFVFPVADRLVERRKPVCFYSGYDRGILPARFRDLGFVQKPHNAGKIVGKLTLSPSSGTVIAQLPDLRAAAVLLTRDRIVADRLVELTLETALANIAMADHYESVSDWLRVVMHALFRQEESAYLH